MNQNKAMITLEEKLEKCLDVLEQIHSNLRYAEDWAVVNKLLHDLGRYKKS